MHVHVCLSYIVNLRLKKDKKVLEDSRRSVQQNVSFTGEILIP